MIFSRKNLIVNPSHSLQKHISGVYTYFFFDDRLKYINITPANHIITPIIQTLTINAKAKIITPIITNNTLNGFIFLFPNKLNNSSCFNIFGGFSKKSSDYFIFLKYFLPIKYIPIDITIR